MGWIVNPKTHPGFTGKLRPSKTEDSGRPVGISAQIPQRPFPYYTDAITELAFVMPTLRPSAGDSSASLRSVESSDSGQDVSSFSFNASATMAAATNQPQQLLTPSATSQLTTRQTSVPTPQSITHSTDPAPQTTEHHTPTPSTPSSGKNMYMNIDAFSPKDPTVSESTVVSEGYPTYPGPSTRTKKTTRAVESFLAPMSGGGGGDTPRRRGAVPQDVAALVVWLEKFEDHTNFPTEVLSRILHGSSLSPGSGGSHRITINSKKSLPVVFIHKMASGLYQIATHNSEGK